jgi:hypothetical protein
MRVVDTGNRPPIWLGLALSGACVVAFADLPYGYYQLLRVAITGYAAWTAWQAFENNRTTWAWTFGFLAVLYNPLIKISLDREIWSVVNLVTATIIVTELCRFRPLDGRESKNRES